MPVSENTSAARQAPRSRAAPSVTGPKLADASKLTKPRPPSGAADQLGPYLYRIPMSSGVWAISTDETPGAVLPRGLYQQERDPEADSTRYAFRASLPYVHARVVRRDGSGRQSTVDYLISATRESPRAIVTHHQVRTGEWAGAVSVPLSDDSKIVAAAGTAIRHMRPLSGDYAGEREAVPRIDPDGKVTVPVAEVLPDGYLSTGTLKQADALALWRQQIAPVAIANPRLALVMGASFVGPWIGALGPGLCHIVDLYGDPAQGKTTALYVTGGLWGNSLVRGGVVRSWNATKISIGRLLGSLGILPACLDERGLAAFSPAEWGQVIYSITDGPRQASDRSATGFHLTSPWEGVVISAGNGRMLDGLGAGKYAGVVRRVVGLSTPFTQDAEEAESVIPALREAFGHPGAVALDRFATAEVDRLIRSVVPLVGMPTAPAVRTIAKCLHADVAGAAMLDQVLGTGTAIRDAAARAARDYLEAHGQDPEHDADRMLTLIRDSLSSEPARWPTVAEYREHRMPRPTYGQDGTPDDPDRVELPQHGVDRHLMGVRADTGDWFAVFGTALDDVLGRAGADRSVALAEADRRRWLHRTSTDRKSGKMATFIKHVGRAHRFNLPTDDDHQDQAEGVTAPAPDACVLCGDPTEHRINGEPWHPWHYEPEPETETEAEADLVNVAEADLVNAPAVALCPGCSLPLPDGEGLIIGGYHVCCAPEDEPAASPEPAPEPPAAMTPGDDHGQAPEPAKTRSEPRATTSDDDELVAFTREVTSAHPDTDPADIAAALGLFHEAYGLRFLRSASWTGITTLRRDVALFGAKNEPQPRSAPVLAEIRDAGPVRHVAFVVAGRTVREGLHFTGWDINGQHPAGAGSAYLGTAEPEYAASPRTLAPFLGLPGYVQIGRQVRTGHPAYGTLAKGDWVTMPHVKFLAADLGIDLPAAGVLFWGRGNTSKHMATFTARYRKAREVLSGRPGLPAEYARTVIKAVANKTVGMLHSEDHNRTEFYLPDWYDQIVSTAEANLLRHLRKIERAGGGLPIGKCADGAWWVSSTEREHPAGLEESGQLGKWRLEKWGSVTVAIVAAYRDKNPGVLQSAIKAADAARREGGRS
jgi:hypothetical protein